LLLLWIPFLSAAQAVLALAQEALELPQEERAPELELAQEERAPALELELAQEALALAELARG
jgi:hypothetical protein